MVKDKWGFRGGGLLVRRHQLYMLSILVDNGLNGDLLSEEEERSRSDLDEEDGEDSMDSDKVGALNLVTSSHHSPTRLASRGRTQHREKLHVNNNNNMHHLHLHKGGGGGGGRGEGTLNNGQLSPPSPINPSSAHLQIQTVLAALQAGHLTLNQVRRRRGIWIFGDNE
jgi:hypothetical protein